MEDKVVEAGGQFDNKLKDNNMEEVVERHTSCEESVPIIKSVKSTELPLGTDFSHQTAKIEPGFHSQDCSLSPNVKFPQNSLEDHGCDIETMGKENQLSIEFQKNWNSIFPGEITLAVLMFVKPEDLLKVAQTCKSWRVAAEDENLWIQKCKEVELLHSFHSGIEKKIKRRNKNNGFVYSIWKAIYLQSYRIEMNFRHTIPKVITVEEECREGTIMEIFNNKVVHNHENNYYVDCASSGQRLAFLGRGRGRNNVQMDEQFIVIGLNRIIKVWRFDTLELMHTLEGHTGDVNCIQMHRGIAVSCSENETSLRMWNIQEGTVIRLLTGHLYEVRFIQFNGKFVVSSDIDAYIKVWDPQTGECLRSMDGDTKILTLKFNGVHIVSGHLTHYRIHPRIKIWDLNTGARLRSLVGYDPRLGLRPSNNFMEDGVLVLVDRPSLRVPSDADMSTATVWNTNGGGYLSRLDDDTHNHTNEITDIQFNKKFVVTSSWDATVKLWDINIGEFIRDLYQAECRYNGRVTQIRMKDGKILCKVRHINGFKFILLDFNPKDVNEEKGDAYEETKDANEEEEYANEDAKYGNQEKEGAKEDPKCANRVERRS